MAGCFPRRCKAFGPHPCRARSVFGCGTHGLVFPLRGGPAAQESPPLLGRGGWGCRGWGHRHTYPQGKAALRRDSSPFWDFLVCCVFPVFSRSLRV